MGNCKQHLLDIENIKSQFEEGSLIALNQTSEFNVMYGPTVYNMISGPGKNDAGEALYRLGYLFDGDGINWSGQFTIAEMMNKFYFFKLTDEVYD